MISLTTIQYFKTMFAKFLTGRISKIIMKSMFKKNITVGIISIHGRPNRDLPARKNGIFRSGGFLTG